ncbi:MAG: replication factor C small subunit [Candidatus ainarchaeum sp.]|nr:replication factor C small subunit [Candidatus ainarchaeum sp.]
MAEDPPSSDIPWTEKYRPRSLPEVCGQNEIVERMRAYARHRNVPHMLFSGPPGIGKTTIALALARELFGEGYSSSFLELNASDERGIDVVRGKIKDFARTLPLSAVPFKLVFLDESDALTPEAQNALRRTMEMFAGNTRFILSCNYSSKIIEPIQSRCAVFRFRPLGEEEVKGMVCLIAEKEGIALDAGAAKAICYVSEGDMRKAINALQGAAAVSRHVTEELVHKVSSRARPEEVRRMLEAALKGDFAGAREKLDFLMLNYGMSGEDVLLQMYKEVTALGISDREKVALVDRIGEYNFRLVEGANERIQLEALLAQVMLLSEKG